MGAPRIFERGEKKDEQVLDRGLKSEYNNLSLRRTVRREKFSRAFQMEGEAYGSFLCLLSFSKESKLVSIAVRVHPFPSRTRQLSSLALTILVW